MTRAASAAGRQPAPRRRTLVNVLGVVYIHKKTPDGGDIYLTRFAERYEKHLKLRNWHEREWFRRHRERLPGTSFVYRVPTRRVDGTSVELVVKNCRVGEDVPLDTHTLREFCDAEFNSPWEEFALVMEMREGWYGPKDVQLRTQRPLAIHVPPERMQLWQSGRSRAKINRIRARHPGIDVDILKQYKMVYEWIPGRNPKEILEGTGLGATEMAGHLRAMHEIAHADLSRIGYLMADMKPEHVIFHAHHCARFDELAAQGDLEALLGEMYRLIDAGDYSIIDYELLFRTPEHEDRVKASRRHSYLDDQKARFVPTEMPAHLSQVEILGVPYVHGHAESTGGSLWVVGRNARLFDYFLPERWRKTPALGLSETNEVFYTVTKDNIHLVWKTSRVGELPDEADPARRAGIRERGINSPFEEFALSQRLNALGIPCVYVRAVYMTGTGKEEPSRDRRRYESHAGITGSAGEPVLRADRNYIMIRGYYNGPDEWVPEHEGHLYTPVNLARALEQDLISSRTLEVLHRGVIERLREAGFDGTLLEPSDLIVPLDAAGRLVRDPGGRPQAIICDMECIWPLGAGADPGERSGLDDRAARPAG